MEWKKISEEEVGLGYRTFLQRTYSMPNGKEALFTIKKEADIVCCLALTKDKKVILVKQFRQGPEEQLVDIPAGMIDKNELPEDAMKRELLEETGYMGEIEFVAKKYIGSYSTSTAYIFFVRNCEKIAEQKLDESEFIEVELMDFEEFRKELIKGDFILSGAAYMALDHAQLL